MDTEDQTALAMVRTGYAVDDPTDRNRVLDFRVGFKDIAAAQEACRVIDSYNGFDGERVSAALAEVGRISRSFRVQVGREGSPVIYVAGFFSDDEEHKRIAEALQEAGPDELDVYGNREVRAWWD